MNGHEEVVGTLLGAKVEAAGGFRMVLRLQVQAKDGQGLTALMWATRAGTLSFACTMELRSWSRGCDEVDPLHRVGCWGMGESWGGPT